jgi:uncharacterized membrane protein
MSHARIALALTAALVCASPALAQDAAPSYTKDVRPFLTKYCTECHKSTNAKAGLNLDSYEAILKGAKKRKVLVVGRADESRLVTTVEGKARPLMPPRNKLKPTDQEVAMLRAWVAAGAKDDTVKGAWLDMLPIPMRASRVSGGSTLDSVLLPPLTREARSDATMDICTGLAP